MKKLIIAIDGPAAAGKSSAAKGLAKRLGYLYLDSGSLYRAMAWKMIQEKANLEAAWEVEALCQPLNIELRLKGETTEIWVDEENVTPHLRLPEVTRVSATISAFPGVRKKLLTIQRLIGGSGGVVVEGRDIGTVVFPEADVKFYLDAATPVRGMRRFKEFQARGVAADLQTTTREIEERDSKDSHRAVAPLKRGADAIVIDSTPLQLEEVIERMVQEVERRGPEKKQ
ncbi:MAG TPA: (d)CMP kinase [Candidatus Manganitrophaceae bacterium]|nr:(d)CMP kinase [Candidatus Manganitrophaceae bacterium]